MPTSALTSPYIGGTTELLFGDNFDGNITISSNTTLTRDMYYDTLIVAAGITLNTGGYRILLKNRKLWNN